jgi:hypothetical protein
MMAVLAAWLPRTAVSRRFGAYGVLVIHTREAWPAFCRGAVARNAARLLQIARSDAMVGVRSAQPAQNKEIADA